MTMNEKRFFSVDLIVATLLFLSSAVLVHKAAVWDTDLYERSHAFDVWFDADVNSVFNLETSRWEKNNRHSFHPLWAYLSFPPVYALAHVPGIGKVEAVRLFHSAIGGFWVAGLFLLFRRAGLRRTDAAVFTALGATTSAAFFWLPATETFAAGSLSMFPALALCIRDGKPSPVQNIAAQILSIGVTITNWMAGVFASLLTLRFRTAAAITVGVGVLTVAGQHLQRFIYPDSIALVKGAGVAPWIFTVESGGPWAILRVFFFSSVVAPEVSFTNNFRSPAWPLLSFQDAPLLSGTVFGWIATPAWAALLGLGLIALTTMKGLDRLRKLIGLLLLYQLWMHLLYGRETFLYAMHFVPLLVIATALATLTRWRTLALALALVVTVTNGLNNRAQFLWARDYSARSPKLVKVQDEIIARTRWEKRHNDPVLWYRFWRDILGWAPPLVPETTEPAGR